MNTSEGNLRQLHSELEILRLHGWPDPGLVIKPPFNPALVTMPPDWIWGQSRLCDAEDSLETTES